MNFYEALVMTFFAAVALVLAVSNYLAQQRSDTNNKKMSKLSAENEKLKAENNRLKFGKQIEFLFMEFKDDAVRRGGKK